jgi:pimeloyl-ACP methyl ester carboxylesterase
VTGRRDVSVDGVSLACHIRGDDGAPPLVLLHGLGSQASTWDTAAAEFAKHFRVVAIDQRGHGASDRPDRGERAGPDRPADTRGHGGPGSHVPQDKIAEAAARVPDARLQVIPVGHQVHANRPAGFAAAALDFLLG